MPARGARCKCFPQQAFVADATTTPANPVRSARRLVLGIETSCDETAAAVVARAADGHGQALSSIVRSQWEQHRPYGGVVPEIAARAHVECLDEIIAAALAEAGVGFRDLSGVAATAGPGLIGGLLVGLTAAKAIALVHGLPLIAVNHLEAHALTTGLTENLQPPYVLLLVSGGHTQLLLIEDVGRYVRLGTTIDDALGEAFDKTAKLLGLPQPGGPSVERAARTGCAARFPLPRPMLGRPEPHFSFAGLKTAVRLAAEAAAPLDDQTIADLCASFEQAVVDAVVDRTRTALRIARARTSGASERVGAQEPNVLVVAGGVAANQRLRAGLTDLATRENVRLSIPPIALCTDNAAMVAWAGAEHLARNETSSLDFAARARWPLDADATPVIGSGRLGTKA
jgi:N6-L-threonylcarbamoyladenine synthase